MDELAAAIDVFDADANIGCLLLTGNEKAFAAGADIKEMADRTFIEAFLNNFAGTWDAPAHARKPIVAAVAGFALGGGCELAMMCDFMIAADNAKFGQPEIKLGVIPGTGGTQRLTRAVGKAKAMDIILTGRMMDAAEAESVRPGGARGAGGRADGRGDEGRGDHRRHVRCSSVLTAKETVNRAFETRLAEGVQFERRAFHSLFATEDQKEGMEAFVEKRKPEWKNK